MAVTAQELAELFVDALNLEGVTPDDIDHDAPLFGGGLGLDSLDMLEISLIVQKKYGVRLRADDPDNVTIFASLTSLAEHINSNRPASA